MHNILYIMLNSDCITLIFTTVELAGVQGPLMITALYSLDWLRLDTTIEADVLLKVCQVA